jgi:hypothetical protein
VSFDCQVFDAWRAILGSRFHPGGNVTGFWIEGDEALIGKQLDLLSHAVRSPPAQKWHCTARSPRAWREKVIVLPAAMDR